MIYGYMNSFYSSRDIENACRRDINFMFLLEGVSSPDHLHLQGLEAFILQHVLKKF
jgi:transposase